MSIEAFIVLISRFRRCLKKTNTDAAKKIPTNTRMKLNVTEFPPAPKIIGAMGVFKLKNREERAMINTPDLSVAVCVFDNGYLRSKELYSVTAAIIVRWKPED